MSVPWLDVADTFALKSLKQTSIAPIDIDTYAQIFWKPDTNVSKSGATMKVAARSDTPERNRCKPTVRCPPTLKNHRLACEARKLAARKKQTKPIAEQVQKACVRERVITPRKRRKSGLQRLPAPQSFVAFVQKCENQFGSRARAWFVLCGKRMLDRVPANHFNDRIQKVMHYSDWSKSNAAVEVQRTLSGAGVSYQFDHFDPALAMLLDEMLPMLRRKFGTIAIFWKRALHAESTRSLPLSTVQTAFAPYVPALYADKLEELLLATQHGPLSLLTVANLSWLDTWKNDKKTIRLDWRRPLAETLCEALRKVDIEFVQGWIQYINMQLAGARFKAPVSYASIPYDALISICQNIRAKTLPNPEALWNRLVASKSGRGAVLGDFLPEASRVLGDFQHCLKLHLSKDDPILSKSMLASEFLGFVTSVGFTGNCARLISLLEPEKQQKLPAGSLAALLVMHLDRSKPVENVASSIAKIIPQQFDRADEKAWYRARKRLKNIFVDPSHRSLGVQTHELFPSTFPYGRRRRTVGDITSKHDICYTLDGALRKVCKLESSMNLRNGLTFLSTPRMVAAEKIQRAWRESVERRDGVSMLQLRLRHSFVDVSTHQVVAAVQVLRKHLLPWIRKRQAAGAVVRRWAQRWCLRRLLHERFERRKRIHDHWAQVFEDFMSLQPPDNWMLLFGEHRHALDDGNWIRTLKMQLQLVANAIPSSSSEFSSCVSSSFEESMASSSTSSSEESMSSSSTSSSEESMSSSRSGAGRESIALDTIGSTSRKRSWVDSGSTSRKQSEDSGSTSRSRSFTSGTLSASSRSSSLSPDTSVQDNLADKIFDVESEFTEAIQQNLLSIERMVHHETSKMEAVPHRAQKVEISPGRSSRNGESHQRLSHSVGSYQGRPSHIISESQEQSTRGGSGARERLSHSAASAQGRPSQSISRSHEQSPRSGSGAHERLPHSTASYQEGLSRGISGSREQSTRGGSGERERLSHSTASSQGGPSQSISRSHEQSPRSGSWVRERLSHSATSYQGRPAHSVTRSQEQSSRGGSRAHALLPHRTASYQEGQSHGISGPREQSTHGGSGARERLSHSAASSQGGPAQSISRSHEQSPRSGPGAHERLSHSAASTQERPAHSIARSQEQSSRGGSGARERLSHSTQQGRPSPSVLGPRGQSSRVGLGTHERLSRSASSYQGRPSHIISRSQGQSSRSGSGTYEGLSRSAASYQGEPSRSISKSQDQSAPCGSESYERLTRSTSNYQGRPTHSIATSQEQSSRSVEFQNRASGFVAVRQEQPLRSALGRAPSGPQRYSHSASGSQVGTALTDSLGRYTEEEFSPAFSRNDPFGDIETY